MDRPVTAREQHVQRLVLCFLMLAATTSLTAWYATGLVYFAVAAVAIAVLVVGCALVWCSSRSVQLHGGPMDGARVRVAPNGRLPGAHLDVLTFDGDRVRYGRDTAGRLTFRGDI